MPHAKSFSSKEKLPKELKAALSQLNYSKNQAKSKLSFHPVLRTWGKLNEFFGIKIEDKAEADKPVTIAAVEELYIKLVEETRKKYEQQLLSAKEKDNTSKITSGDNSVALEPRPDTGKRHNESDGGTLYLESGLQSSYIRSYPNQKAELLTKEAPQEQNAKVIWDNFTLEGKLAQLVIAATGSGKTYIAGSFLKNFVEQGYVEKFMCMSPWPIMYVTKASVVAQTERVLREEFGLDTVQVVNVVNIEMLRTHLGSKFVREETVVIQGEPHIKFQWKKNIHPCLILWDECQILARPDSIQSKIALAFGEIPELYDTPVAQVFLSATPGSRVCEFKVFACATKAKFQLGLGESRINSSTWSMFANRIADPASPEEYCEAAVKRLIHHLEPYIVRVVGIRPKHKAYNSVARIHFQTKEERAEYEAAWADYQKKKAQIEGQEGLSASQERFALLAQFTIFAKKAEYIRRHYIARFIVDCANNNEAPVVACRNKGTISAVVKILIQDYNWTRDDISIIWGGATESLSQRKKLAKKVKQSEAVEAELAKLGITMEDLGLDYDLTEKTEEELTFEKANRMLTQSAEAREIERIRFQRQDSKTCLFTFKAGGVGLSLHHEKQYTKALPRRVLFAPVYSEKELVQAVGRAPRITSQSDTYQVMSYYAGTIEEHMAERVKMKLKNLKAVVQIREHWEDIITGKPVLEEENSGDNEDMLDAVDELTEGNPIYEYKEQE